jgi:hypothetical protein
MLVGSGDVLMMVGFGDMFLLWWVPGICSYDGGFREYVLMVAGSVLL